MSSWVPLRPAPSEPLCLPSTSYAANSVVPCNSRLREHRGGAQSRRLRSSYPVLCQATQALQSYHNAFKLLHQPGRSGEPSTTPDPAGGQQRHKGRRGQPQPAHEQSHDLEQQPAGPGSEQLSGSYRGQANGHAAPSHGSSTPTDPYPNSGGLSASAAEHRPYTPHSVSLPQWQPPPTSMQHRTALTRAITTCASYTRLHQLIVDNAADFNAYHTCAALSRLMVLHTAGLTPRESRLFKEGCSTMQTILRRQLPELQPRAVVMAAYSLARLELPDRELLAGLAAAVEPHLSALKPQGLSSLIWAFARQGHQPSPKWMDALLSAVAADLEAFGPRDMATVIWALARLHYKVAPTRLNQLMEHVKAQMGGFCGRSLSNVVYSLALSQQHPGDEWLVAAQARAMALGPATFTPQGITQMTWGLAKLGGSPTPEFLDLVQDHAAARLPLSPQERLREREQQQREGGGGRRRRLGRYNGVDLSTFMYSLASLGAQPRADLSRKLLAALQWELPSMEANQMCNCLWACARLRLYPHKTWLKAFFDASYRQLPYFKPVDLSQSLWALARLQALPPDPWVAAVLTRLQHTASMFTPVDVASTMWALARLGVRGDRLPAEVLALFFIATDRRLSSFKPQELCSMIWALAHMRRRPDKEWTAEFLKVTYHKLATMNGWCLATLAWSLSELSLLPPPAWTYSYVNAARGLLDILPLPQAAPPQQDAGVGPEAAAKAAGSSQGQDAAGLSAMDLGQIITALRRLNGSGGSGGGGLTKVEDFLKEAEQRLGAVEAGSGAYARQQVGVFLAMSPGQAGMGSQPTVEEPNGGDGEPGEAGGGSAAAAPASVRRRRRRSSSSSSSSSLSLAERLPLPAGAEAVGNGVEQLWPYSGQPGAAAAADPGLREVTRVLRGGARVTLSAPAELHLELGDLNVELSPPSGSVAWHASSCGSASNGAGGEPTSVTTGGEAGAANAAEIKKRLLAV